jgi:hypothetical protein
MDQEVKEFTEIVQNANLKFNKITGRLLAYLLDKIKDKIEAMCEEDDDRAIALRNTSAFLGKRGAKAELSQDSAELLLSLQPKPVAAKVVPAAEKPAS